MRDIWISLAVTDYKFIKHTVNWDMK